MIRVFGADCEDCEKFKQNVPCNDEHRFCDKSLAEHDEKIIADTLEVIIKGLNALKDRGYDTYYIDAEIEFLKQLKGQTE